MVLSAFLGVSVFATGYAQAHENQIFLRSKKHTEALKNQSEAAKQTAPTARQEAQPRNNNQQALRQQPSQALGINSPNLLNPATATCTQKDLEAYKKIEQAMDAALVIDQETLKDHKKLEDAEEERFRSAQKIMNFMNDPAKSKAYTLLLVRCGDEIGRN